MAAASLNVPDPVTELVVSKLFFVTSKRPITFALYGAKTTFVPTVAAPINLLPMVRAPVDTVSKLFVVTSKRPISFALYGAKTTFVPTVAAPRNL